MNELPANLAQQIMHLLDEETPKREIEQLMLDKGYDSHIVTRTIEECTVLRNNRRRAKGMLLIMAGALACFTSFLLTLTSSSISESSWQLFGLTSIGVSLVMAGLFYIFG